MRDVEPFIDVALPAVEPQPLVEIAARVEQAEADQGDAEIGSGLAVVSREHAQPAGINRHRVVKAELGAEVHDAAFLQRGVVRHEPGAVARLLALQPLHHLVEVTQELRVFRALRETRRIHAPQQLDRVVPREMPQRLIDRLEQRARFVAPAPRQVVREIGQPDDAVGKVGNLVLGVCHGPRKLHRRRHARKRERHYLLRPVAGAARARSGAASDSTPFLVTR